MIHDVMNTDSALANMAKHLKSQLKTVENNLMMTYASMIKRDKNIMGALETLISGVKPNLKYTTHGLINRVKLPVKLDDQDVLYVEALDACMSEKNVTVDMRLNELTQPVLDYLLLHITHDSQTLVRAINGVEETISFINVPVKDRQEAKSILKSTGQSNELMVILDDVGDTEVVV